MEDLYTYADVIMAIALVTGLISLGSILIDIGAAALMGLATLGLLGLMMIVPGADSTAVTGEPLARMMAISKTDPKVRAMIAKASKDGSISIAEYRRIKSAYDREQSDSANEELRSMSTNS